MFRKISLTFVLLISVVACTSAQRLLAPTDALSQGASWRLFHRYDDLDNGIGAHDNLPYLFWAWGERVIFNDAFDNNDNDTFTNEGSICVPFEPFGVDEICRQIDGRLDAWGGMDQSYWKIGEGGNFVPGHQHVRADTLFTLVEGTCEFFTDYDKKHGTNVDPVGMKWLNHSVIGPQGTFYIGRGTTFAWGCTPNAKLWFLNAEGGSTGGIPFALATQVFHPNGQFYSGDLAVLRAHTVQVSELYNTRFLDDALDIVFGPL